MLIVEGVGIGVLLLLVALLALFVRRALVARAGGTIKLSVRLSDNPNARGWSPGFARFAGDELRWYRMFSFSPSPRRILSRHGLVVQTQRVPAGPERLTLPGDWVVLRCVSHRVPVDIAMASSTVTGFLSWLEAAPPGAVPTRLATH
ncbi:MAG TPA: DUF2550 domain-containing protein [Pilimelia sp.]|nr:DUF2550 domain-containing protein [Pilimelia sp.]